MRMPPPWRLWMIASSAIAEAVTIWSFARQ
jgi:hypothetical protein